MARSEHLKRVPQISIAILTDLYIEQPSSNNTTSGGGIKPDIIEGSQDREAPPGVPLPLYNNLTPSCSTSYMIDSDETAPGTNFSPCTQASASLGADLFDRYLRILQNNHKLYSIIDPLDHLPPSATGELYDTSTLVRHGREIQ